MAERTAVDLLMEQIEQSLRGLVSVVHEARRVEISGDKPLDEAAKALMILLHISSHGKNLNNLCESLQKEMKAAMEAVEKKGQS